MCPRPLSRLACATFGTIVLAGCFTSTADFKSDAEAFIADQVAVQVETTFTNVNCDAPIDQSLGTRFACQAIDADGGVWEFDNLIDGDGQFTVNIAQRP